MSIANLPYATIARPIPIADRRRVWVRRFGAGTTVDRLTLGSMITGYGVQFDSGERATVAPCQISYDVPAVAASNVVPFRRPEVWR